MQFFSIRRRQIQVARHSPSCYNEVCNCLNAGKRAVLTAVMMLVASGGFIQVAAEEKTVSIRLPEPVVSGTTSVEEALQKRRSVRSYASGPLTLAEVSQLLWAAQGITRGEGLRTAPSAGALYPLEVYLVAGDVTDLPAGVYKYIPQRHELERVIAGDRRNDLCTAALNQSSVRNAPAVVVFSAVYERTSWKYGARTERYVHMEVGHASQNVFLQAVPLRLGTVVIGAFDDKYVKRVLRMPAHEEPLYIMPIGRIR